MPEFATYDLMSPQSLANPHPIYHRMREENPVCYMYDAEQKAPVWLLTRYDDCAEFLKDNSSFYKDFAKHNAAAGDDAVANAAAVINRHMLTVDPPDHTRMRGLVHKAFTPRIIESLGPRIQQIADDLLDKMGTTGEADLIMSYAFPLPITVIAELLGIPAEDQARFRNWSQTIILNSLRGENLDDVGVAVLEFIMYFHALFEERRANPGEDLITGLLAAEEAGDKLDQQELISMIFLLLAAGHETTVNLIGNGTLALMQNPDQMTALRENPALIRTAVEEMLRYGSPVSESTPRWAIRDLDLHGQKVRQGDMVTASLIAANRDPAEFANPDVFDIKRTPNRHLAFGNGIHYCLGAPLARLEGTIATNTLLRRLPDLHLAVPVEALEWTPSLLLHGLKALPIRY
jgi:cytochrome P450 PksS